MMIQKFCYLLPSTSSSVFEFCFFVFDLPAGRKQIAGFTQQREKRQKAKKGRFSLCVPRTRRSTSPLSLSKS